MTKAKLAFLSLLLFSLSGPLISAETDTVSININQATAEQLASALTGIGESKAQAIVEYRELYGNFETVEELAEVKGIGDAILSANASIIEL